MTKQQIMDTVRDCMEKLGHVPSHRELTRMSMVSRKQIRWHFGNYTRLMRECNLEKWGGGIKVEMDDLVQDWAGMVRDLKKLPSQSEYSHFSKYSVSPLVNRFGNWAQVPYGIQQYIDEQGRAEEMEDVLEVISLQGPHVKQGRSLRTLRQGPEDMARAETSGLGNGPDDLIPLRPHDGASTANDEAADSGVYGSLMRFGPEIVCEV